MTETVNRDINAFIVDVIEGLNVLKGNNDFGIFRDSNRCVSLHKTFTSKKTLENLKKSGIPRYGNGCLRPDNGVFSIKNKLPDYYPTIEEVLERYSYVGLKKSEYAPVLDYFTDPNDSIMVNRNKALNTVSNFYKSRALAGKYNLNYYSLGLVVQAFDLKTLELVFKEVMTGNEELIFIGSYCPLLGKKGVKKTDIRQKSVNIGKILKANKKIFENTRFHALGSSGPSTLHLMVLQGITEFDTTGPKLRAAGGKLMFAGTKTLPGVPEAYIGNGTAKFGNTKWKDEFDMYLMMCDCPVCQGFTLAERKEILKNYTLRLIHNLWNFFKEVELAKDLEGDTKAYVRYLREVKFKKSGFYRNWVNMIDPSNDTKDITAFLRTRLGENVYNPKNIEKKVLLLTGCTKKKATSPQEAQNLYISDDFKKIVGIANSLGFDLRIISANENHPLLHPNKTIAPYDKVLKTKQDVDKIKKEVNLELGELMKNYDKVICLRMSEKYRDVISDSVNEKVIQIVDSRGIGGYKQIISKLSRMNKKKFLRFIEMYVKNPSETLKGDNLDKFLKGGV